MGINSAYRANELLSLSVGQVDYLKTGDRLELKQSKQNVYRSITVNQTAIEAIEGWLSHHPNPRTRAPLFPSYQKDKVLTVPTVCNLMKRWCKEAKLHGNYGSHTMRKTWGYWQYKNGTKIPLLMEAFGHTTQKQTLDYLCIQSAEIQELYTKLEL